MKPRLLMIVALLAMQSPALLAANTIAEQLMAEWQKQAQLPFSVERGKTTWQAEHTAADGTTRSCTTCHHSDLTKSGQHIRTKKVIEPMAPSVNPKRFTDARKINKWLLRNCKWTLGRKCTAQEKGDILAYLLAQ